MTEIVASVLDADFSNWKKWLKELEEAKIKRIQWDIMDNKFVNNSGVDKKYVGLLRKNTRIFFEAHLMTLNPENYIKEFSENGTNLLIFHIEATNKPFEIIETIEDHGLKVGVAIDSQTKEEKVFPFLDKVDVALIMSVKAGLGGQNFETDSLRKISKVKEEIEKYDLQCKIEVDGGLNPENAKKCVEAGADLLVVGSFIFKSKLGIKEAIKQLEQQTK